MVTRARIDADDEFLDEIDAAARRLNDAIGRAYVEGLTEFVMNWFTPPDGPPVFTLTAHRAPEEQIQ